MQGRGRTDLATRLGWWGVVRVVWRAIPWQYRLLVFPYFWSVYRGLFKACACLDEVRLVHIDLYQNSLVFRMFRPRFRMIKRALLPLDVTPSHRVVREAAETVRHTAYVRKVTKHHSGPRVCT